MIQSLCLYIVCDINKRKNAVVRAMVPSFFKVQLFNVFMFIVVLDAI